MPENPARLPPISSWLGLTLRANDGAAGDASAGVVMPMLGVLFNLVSDLGDPQYGNGFVLVSLFTAQKEVPRKSDQAPICEW